MNRLSLLATLAGVVDASVAGAFWAVEPPANLNPALRTRVVVLPGAVEVRFSCAADFNGDGFVDPDDLSDFITCFFLDVQFPGICVESDFNGDGFRDPDDLADFITIFFLGC